VFQGAGKITIFLFLKLLGRSKKKKKIRTKKESITGFLIISFEE